jgi:hypothetical protein
MRPGSNGSSGFSCFGSAGAGFGVDTGFGGTAGIGLTIGVDTVAAGVGASIFFSGIFFSGTAFLPIAGLGIGAAGDAAATAGLARGAVLIGALAAVGATLFTEDDGAGADFALTVFFAVGLGDGFSDTFWGAFLATATLALPGAAFLAVTAAFFAAGFALTVFTLATFAAFALAAASLTFAWCNCFWSAANCFSNWAMVLPTFFTGDFFLLAMSVFPEPDEI